MTCPTSPSNYANYTAERRALYDDTSSSCLSYQDPLSFRGLISQIQVKSAKCDSIFNKHFTHSLPRNKQERRSLVKKIAGNPLLSSRDNFSQSLLTLERSQRGLGINPSSLALLDSEAEPHSRGVEHVRLMSPLSQERMPVCMKTASGSFKSEVWSQSRIIAPTSERYLAQLKQGHRFANMQSQKQLRVMRKKKIEQTRSLNQSPRMISNCSSKEKLALNYNSELKLKSHFSTPVSPSRRGFVPKLKNFQKSQNIETRTSDLEDLTNQISYLSFSSQLSERFIMVSKLKSFKSAKEEEEPPPLEALNEEIKKSETFQKATSPFTRCLSSDQQEIDFDFKDLLVSGLKIKVKQEKSKQKKENAKIKLTKEDQQPKLNQDLMMSEATQFSEELQEPLRSPGQQQLNLVQFERRKASSLSRPTTPVKTLKVPSINITSKFTRRYERRKLGASLSRRLKKFEPKHKMNLTLNQILGIQSNEVVREANEDTRSLEISTRSQTVFSDRLDSSSSLASLEEPPSSWKAYKIPQSSGRGTESKGAPPSLFARPTLRLKQLI